MHAEASRSHRRDWLWRSHSVRLLRFETLEDRRLLAGLISSGDDLAGMATDALPAPTGSIVIDGDTTHAISTSVALTPSAADDGDHVAGMRFGDDGSTTIGSTDPGNTAYPSGGMRNVGEVLLPSGVNAQYNAAIDPTTGFGYFGTSAAAGNTQTLSLVNLHGPLPTLVTGDAAQNIPANVKGLLGIVIDTSDRDPSTHYLYAGTATGQILRMSPGDATHVPQVLATLSPTSATGAILCGVIDPANHYAYFGVNGAIPKVVRVNLATFTDAGAVPLNMSSVRSAGIDLVNGYAYFTNFTTNVPQIAKVNLQAFDAAHTSTYSMDSTTPGDGIGRVGYDVPRFDEGLVIDPVHRFAYIGTYNCDNTYTTKNLSTWPYNQSIVVRVNLGSGDGFPAHPLTTLDLQPGERDLSAAVFDQANGNIYFGTDNTYPAHVYKIHVGDGTGPMTEIGRLDLNMGTLPADQYPPDGVTHQASDATLYGEIYLRSAILDSANNSIYFGTDTTPGQVIKVQMDQQGTIKGSKLVLSRTAQVNAVRFYSHAAAGTVRLAVYDDSPTKTLFWQSNPIANVVADAWITAPVLAGTLRLSPGTYWLAWQIDTTVDAPGYTAGSEGNGFCVEQSFGAFPAALGNVQSTAETWSMNLSVDANIAPVLSPTGTQTFTTIDEDARDNPGDPVSEIVNGTISDVDDGAVRGIAITDLTSGRGVWQFSLDGGRTWNDVGLVSLSRTLLLRAQDRLRLVPDGLNADLAAISYHAWDQTSGVVSSRVDLTGTGATGGGTAYSTAADTARITVTAANDTPTDIQLSGAGVPENNIAGTVVGSFASSDVDTGDSFAYSLVSGNGSADNSSFAISGNQLKTAAVFNYETKSSYSVRVRGADSGGLWSEKVFAVVVSNINEDPTGLGLSAWNVAEDQVPGTALGSFDTQDPDAGGTFAYSLVAGTGSDDNSSFTVDDSGNLRTAKSFDYESKSILSIRVRTVDQGGLYFDKAFAIEVTDVYDITTVGIYDPAESRFYLRYSNAPGPVSKSFLFGAPGWEPISGDWNGDDRDTIGLFQREAAQFYLRNTNDTGAADISFGYGTPGSDQILLLGDWDGNGTDTIGLYRPDASLFELRNSNSMGMSDLAFGFGAPGAGWVPLVGDWNGDDIDTVGMYDPRTGMFYLRNSHTTGMADVAFAFGTPNNGWQPLVGDWNGDGIATAGFYQPGAASHFYLRNTLDIGMSDVDFGLGFAGVQPIVGNWLGPTGAPLLAASGVVASLVGTPLDAAAAESALQAALARWAELGSAFGTVQLRVTDLPGAQLGAAVGQTIYLDRDAAGHGWFVDPTPMASEEFVAVAGRSDLKAIDPRAVDRIDLLTVVEHELGHMGGLGGLDSTIDALMSASLPSGVRRLPA
jgi:hypothetical protein